ncbi:hypothetical protein MCEZE4_00440 [Burkholderiaceae bacterium]
MKILFIGCVEFSLKTLMKTVSLGGNVVAVCTLKDSSFNADFCDLSGFANANKIPSLHVDDINSGETISWISHFQPDVIFCFGW